MDDEEIRIEFAKLRYEQAREDSRQGEKIAADFAMMAIRSVILINGGAIVIICGLMGVLARVYADGAFLTLRVTPVVVLPFAVGLAVAVLAALFMNSAFNRFCNRAFSEAGGAYLPSPDEDPWVARGKQGKAANRDENVAGVLILLSAVCFCCGCWVTTETLTEASGWQVVSQPSRADDSASPSILGLLQSQ